jgi:hypothetical protein
VRFISLTIITPLTVRCKTIWDTTFSYWPDVYAMPL